MKTILEAATESVDKIMLNVNFRPYGIGIFKEGVKFAQRWIPVEEELPPKGEIVLTRHGAVDGDGNVLEIFALSYKLDDWHCDFVDDLDLDYNPTHWRPIEYN